MPTSISFRDIPGHEQVRHEEQHGAQGGHAVGRLRRRGRRRAREEADDDDDDGEGGRSGQRRRGQEREEVRQGKPISSLKGTRDQTDLILFNEGSEGSKSSNFQVCFQKLFLSSVH